MSERDLSLSQPQIDERELHAFRVVQEIRATGASVVYGHDIAVYDNYLSKAMSGYLGPQKQQALMQMKRNLEEEFGPNGAIDVLNAWKTSIGLRTHKGTR